jgi:hypothetical protein
VAIGALWPAMLAKHKDTRPYLPHRATILSPYSPKCREGKFSEVHIHDPEYPSLSGWGNAAKHLNNRACAPMLSAGRGSHRLRTFIVLCPVPMP